MKITDSIVSEPLIWRGTMSSVHNSSSGYYDLVFVMFTIKIDERNSVADVLGSIQRLCQVSFIVLHRKLHYKALP